MNDLDFYSLEFEPGWDVFFRNFDSTIQERIWKKISKLRQPLKHRHLKHGLPFFVEEAGGYRIAFKVIDDRKVKRVYFAGTHKQYEAWYQRA